MTNFLILTAVFASVFGLIIYIGWRAGRKGKLDFTPPRKTSAHAVLTFHESMRPVPRSAILNEEQTQRLMAGLDAGTMTHDGVQNLMREANATMESLPEVPPEAWKPSEPVHHEPVHHEPAHIEHSTHYSSSSHDSFSSDGFTVDSGSSFDGGSSSSDGGGSSGSSD